MSENEGACLDLISCRVRQHRFAAILAEDDLEFALLCRPEHIQYFTGFRPSIWLQAILLVRPDGKTVLCAPNDIPAACAADDVITFEAQWNCTLRQDQLQAAMRELIPSLKRQRKQSRIAVEGSANLMVSADQWTGEKSSVVDIEPALWKLRRRKDTDELRLIRRAVDCTEAMYRKAREIIQPGITELEVYHQLVGAAVQVTGEPLTAFGNDFQCNSPGGPPRPRPVQQGELYILDLGPDYRGYFADNCRTFLVDARPTDAQLQAWNAIVDVLEWIETAVRPGVSAAQIYREAKSRLDAVIPGGFFHHLGHGIGLFPHEAPHLNDRWDDFFEVGDTFTAEPGLYAPHLKSGIRLEQNYLVTETGVERLTTFPLDLS